MINKYIFKNIK